MRVLSQRKIRRVWEGVAEASRTTKRSCYDAESPARAVSSRRGSKNQCGARLDLY